MLILFAIVMVAAVACTAETGGDSSDSGSASQTVASDSGQTESAGLDEACVQQVLGRQVTGFADITASERDAIFAQCSGNEQERQQRQGRQLDPSGIGSRLPELDQACVTEITGNADSDLTQLTAEQRQQVFSECLPEGFLGGRTGGFLGAGGVEFGGISETLQACLDNTLNEPIDSLFRLDPEQRDAITAACGDELPEGFGDTIRRAGEGFPGIDGDGAFGGGGRFFGGGLEGAGGFSPLDLSSECVTNLLGRAVTGPGDISPEEFRQIFANCS